MVGCGSIGSRRARILAEMGHEIKVWDTNQSAAVRLVGESQGAMTAILSTSQGSTQMALQPSEWPSTSNAQPEVVLVCTPPETHLDLAANALAAEVRGLYVEKPLALSLGEVNAFAVLSQGGAVTMGACNLRFDERLEGVLTEPLPSQGVFLMAQAAQHWSPGHRPLPMLLDSIHELDLARWILGPITRITGRQTLDYADVEVEHGHRKSLVSLNRRIEPPQRYAELIWPDWGHRTHTLWPPDPEMYRREMEHFMACVEKGEQTCNPLSQAAETCRWALEVPES